MTILNISLFFHPGLMARVETFLTAHLRPALQQLAADTVTLLSLTDEEDTCRRAIHLPLLNERQAQQTMELVVMPLIGHHFDTSSGEIIVFPTVMTVESQWTPTK